MTLQEFTDLAPTLVCKDCGHVGLTTERKETNNGGRCALCGLEYEVARAVGIGFDAHHCTPVDHGGDRLLLIPLCGPCHYHASAAKRSADAIRRAVTGRGPEQDGAGDG